MAAGTRLVKPTNKILVAGKPLVQEVNVETATTMYAGRLVKKGTNDDDAVVCGAATDKVTGWLGFEQTIPHYRPASVATIYNQYDRVALLNGGGFVIVGTLLAGQTCVKGDKFVMGAGGTLVVATGTETMSSALVGVAEETQATAGATVMTRSMI